MIYGRKLRVSMFITNVQKMFKRNVLKIEEQEKPLFISLKQIFTEWSLQENRRFFSHFSVINCYLMYPSPRNTYFFYLCTREAH